VRDLINLGLNRANILGVTYADVRLVRTMAESISLKNGRVEEISSASDFGFGVRVLANGAWGFASSFRLDKKEVEDTTALAVQIARASALAKTKDVFLAPVEQVQASYQTPFSIDPFKVSLEERLDLLAKAEGILRRNKGVKISQASMNIFRRNQIFASSEGSYIEQEITHCGAGIAATAIKEEDIQVRSFPNSHGGQFGAGGYELIESLKLAENAERIAEEAVALLSSKECPSTTTTIVLDSSQAALQVHESLGHPAELDRVMGTEISLAGGSFLTPDKLNNFKYGSEIVNIAADATIQGGLGTSGYDDEGVPAQRMELVKGGIFVGYLTSRETAPLLNQRSNGCMRADGWNRIPLIRMTNINLEPGEPTLEEMISDTDEGIYMETNKSWSIDDKRLNFQFATEMAREIKRGKLGALIKNANYTGLTPTFWGSCDAIADEDHWRMWGIPNCGKGEPVQIAHVGHSASPARFRNVRVGVRK